MNRISHIATTAALALTLLATTGGLSACGGDDEPSGSSQQGQAESGSPSGNPGGPMEPESAGDDRPAAPDDVISERPGGPRPAAPPVSPELPR